MDPPMIPIPGTASSRPPRSSHSSSPRKRPQHSDYPPPDNNASYGLMSGGRAPGTDPVPIPETSPANKTRPNPPADNAAGQPSKSTKRKKNRNRKRRNRHQSFILPCREESHDSPAEISDAPGVRDSMEADRPSSRDKSFFKLGRNLSNTSLESDALLDHR
jgi:magnesium transporter